MSLAGVILAGGASRRMGRPKALLELGGETFLDRLIGVFSESCIPVIVVLGHEAEHIRAGMRRAAEATVVVNPAPELGMLSSLQHGLKAVPSAAAGVLFGPVDCPVETATVRRIAETYTAARGQALVVAPRHAGRRGHPVLVAPAVAAELLALPESAQARDVIRRHENRAILVDVDDAGVAADINDPEAYRRLLKGAHGG